jgi:hypothetical protein
VQQVRPFPSEIVPIWRSLGCALAFALSVSCGSGNEEDDSVNCEAPANGRGTWEVGPTAPPEVSSTYMAMAWSREEVFVFSGCSWGCPYGAAYNPETRLWRDVAPAGEYDSRSGALGFWTGTHFGVWGGDGTSPETIETLYGVRLDNGLLYDPASDSWEPMPNDGARPPGVGGRALYVDGRLFVWGGLRDDPTGRTGGIWRTEGAMWDASTGVWIELPQENKPVSAGAGIMAWTGMELIVWGGWTEYDENYDNASVGSGAAYDPELHRWRTLSSAGAPSPRWGMNGTWTGSELIIFGGQDSDGRKFRDGAAYDPELDRWRPIAQQGAPMSGISVWTGTEMFVWGGIGRSCNIGGLYDPAADRWTPTTAEAPPTRGGTGALWTGTEVIIYGGTAGHRNDYRDVLHFTP